MKSFILIAVLAALIVCYDAATVLPPPQAETVLVGESDQLLIKDYDLGLTGRVFRDDERILFYEEMVDLPAIPHTVQRRDVFYRGNSTTYINRISISSPQPILGFMESRNLETHANVRFTTNLGEGIFNAVVRFYGVYTDWP